MKNTEKKAAEKAATTAEAVKAEETTTEAAPTVENVKKFFRDIKTAVTTEGRKAAEEKAAAAVKAFNNYSLNRAVRLSDFMNAAEAVRPIAPKKAENAVKTYDYTRRAVPVDYTVVSEEGEVKTRRLALVTYAREAFSTTATAEAKKAFSAALKAMDTFEKSLIEQDNTSGAKTAAAAVSELVKAIGLNDFTKTDKGYDFFIHRSFVYAAAAALKAKNGVYTTTAAALEKANNAVLNADAKGYEKAKKAAEAAEKKAVVVVFSIIQAAAAAASRGVWNASVTTAEEMKAAAAKKAAEAAKKAAAEAAAAKTKAAQKAAEALKRAEERAKKAEERAKKAEERAEALKRAAEEEKKSAAAKKAEAAA